MVLGGIYFPPMLEEAQSSSSSFASSSVSSRQHLAPGGSTAVSRSLSSRIRQSLRAPSEAKARQKARTQRLEQVRKANGEFARKIREDYRDRREAGRTRLVNKAHQSWEDDMKDRITTLNTRLHNAVISIGAGHHLAKHQTLEYSKKLIKRVQQQEILIQQQETWSGRAYRAHQKDMDVIRRPWRQAAHRDQIRKQMGEEARVVAKSLEDRRVEAARQAQEEAEGAIKKEYEMGMLRDASRTIDLPGARLMDFSRTHIHAAVIRHGAAPEALGVIGNEAEEYVKEVAEKKAKLEAEGKTQEARAEERHRQALKVAHSSNILAAVEEDLAALAALDRVRKRHKGTVIARMALAEQGNSSRSRRIEALRRAAVEDMLMGALPPEEYVDEGGEAAVGGGGGGPSPPFMGQEGRLPSPPRPRSLVLPVAQPPPPLEDLQWDSQGPATSASGGDLGEEGQFAGQEEEERGQDFEGGGADSMQDLHRNVFGGAMDIHRRIDDFQRKMGYDLEEPAGEAKEREVEETKESGREVEEVEVHVSLEPEVVDVTPSARQESSPEEREASSIRSATFLPASASAAAGLPFLSLTEEDEEYARLRAAVRDEDEEDLWQGGKLIVSEVLRGLTGASASGGGDGPTVRLSSSQLFGDRSQQQEEEDEEGQVVEEVKERSLPFDPKLDLLEEHRKKLEEAKTITREVEASRLQNSGRTEELRQDGPRLSSSAAAGGGGRGGYTLPDEVYLSSFRHALPSAQGQEETASEGEPLSLELQAALDLSDEEREEGGEDQTRIFAASASSGPSTLTADDQRDHSQLNAEEEEKIALLLSTSAAAGEERIELSLTGERESGRPASALQYSSSSAASFDDENLAGLNQLHTEAIDLDDLAGDEGGLEEQHLEGDEDAEEDERLEVGTLHEAEEEEEVEKDVLRPIERSRRAGGHPSLVAAEPISRVTTNRRPSLTKAFHQRKAALVQRLELEERATSGGLGGAAGSSGATRGGGTRRAARSTAAVGTPSSIRARLETGVRQPVSMQEARERSARAVANLSEEQRRRAERERDRMREERARKIGSMKQRLKY